MGAGRRSGYSGNGIKSYADYLASQGKTVVELSGVRWMKYCGALIPASAMPVYAGVARDEARRALKQTRSLFLRHATSPIEAETDWWHMVCRRYEFQSMSGNTRSKIRRGLKRLEIRQVTPAWLAESGYDCHVRSYERYEKASPQTRQQFQRFLRSLDGRSLFDVWACSAGGELLGYIICLREEDGVFLHTVDITPAGLRAYGAYAMIHLILEHYVNEKRIPVSNGTRSIAHATDMQEFLRKFGFAREYSDLRVIYRPDVELIVRLLYPFRNILRRWEGIALVHRISSVLFQEEIVRRQPRLETRAVANVSRNAVSIQ